MYYNFVNPNNLTDAELVRLVQARDEAAFAELMSRYSPRIWNIVVENSRQRRDAEEILMDIWMAVWENIIGLRKAESFGGWLRRIAFTACNRYYASNLHRHGEIILSYEDLALQIDREAEQRFQDARLREDAREAVHHLPQKVRSVAILYYLELWSIKEIADELNLAIGTVKTRLSEVRQLLRKAFEVELETIKGETMSIEQKKFVHLHNHSEYSLLDGACRIPDMVQWAIENSSPAVALTDHGNMFGAWEFYNTAKAAGVNPIVGCEVYVETENAITEGNYQGSLSHLTLLAEDVVGYHNLLELTSLGYTQGFHRKPRINLEMLREHHGGIIALTGCINGIVPKLICSNQRDEAVRNLLQLKDIMGEDNLFVEIQNHYIDEELAAYPVMVELANEFNLPIVGTNDCHYLRKSDHRMHDILLCIQTKKTVNDPKRIRFNNEFYFKNVDEMQEALKDYPPEAIFNTVEIANRCNLKLDYDNSVMPIFEDSRRTDTRQFSERTVL